MKKYCTIAYCPFSRRGNVGRSRLNLSNCLSEICLSFKKRKPGCPAITWVQSIFIIYIGKEFRDLLSSSCPCRRIGRLLYRPKCDPYVMLSHALGATKSGNSKSAPTSPPPLKQVASYLNEKIHDLSSNIAAKRDETPAESCMFNLDEFVSSIPPDLWEMMNELTLSKRDKHGRKQSEAHAHEREVRIAYLVCVVMFCASSGYCAVPLHTLLTDFIEATGGSSEL